MKNIFLYYSAILIPIILLINLAKSNIDSGLFVGLFFFYAFVYRTFTDYLRLAGKNIIGKNDFWKLLIPGSRFKYFRELDLP